VSEQVPDIPAPCIETLSGILRKIFHLRYHKFNPANFKYRDPTFDEKRLWVSRILGQLSSQGWLVISVDESNFRSDTVNHRQWEFFPKVESLKI